MRENEVIHIFNLTFNHISMQFVNKVLREMKQMSTEELEAAKVKLKSTFTFYWKITQEEGINLSRPRGKSAQENTELINQVGLAVKAEIELRTTTPN